MPKGMGYGMNRGATRKKRVKALTAKRKRSGNVKGRGGWKLPRKHS